jgi:tetratricopeptide (TPR) repeat protein
MNPRAEARRLIEQAIALREANRIADGLAHIHSAIAIEPSNPTALFQRGRFQEELLQLDQALESYDEAVRAKPGYAAALGSKAQLLMALRRFDEAGTALDEAIRAKPHFPQTRYLKGELLLLLGRFDEGWEWFEARLDAVAQQHPTTGNTPRWNGEAVAGRRLLVQEEFGLGDVLMMARYFSRLVREGSQLVLAVRSGLVPLMRTSFPHAIVVRKQGEIPAVDFHCPVMSLPHALRDRVRYIPSEFPYLDPGTEPVERWRSKLGMRSRPRVGIAWAGAARAIDRSPLRNRSMPFEALEPLIRLPFEFHSLQQQVFDAAALAGMQQHGPQLRDFTETAALMSQMDVIVSIDTSVAHLAGALGLPLDVMLPYASDYRWQGDQHTVWYPHAQLHRQSTPGDWAAVVDGVADALARQFDVAPTL